MSARTVAKASPARRREDMHMVLAALAVGGILRRRGPSWVLEPAPSSPAVPQTIETTLVTTLKDEGYVTRRKDGTLQAAPRLLAGKRRDPDAFRKAQQDRAFVDDGQAIRVVDHAESPLSWLARRKDAAGRPFLTDEEVASGEKFRRDFTLAGMSPRLGVSWEPAVQMSGGGDRMTYTDTVLAARQRLSKALEAVGPDFAGLLLDICGFLQGIETVEAERGWPARTAKVVLKLALSALARHYGLRAPARAPLGCE